MFGRKERTRLARRVVVPHRIVEQSELLLDAQDAQHRLVELFEARSILSDGGLQIVGEYAAHHVHVDRRIQRENPRAGTIRRHAVIDELADRAPVAHHEALPAPAFAQSSAQQLSIGGGRHARDVVERRHERARACARGSVKRR
jgi:hypothetical protein